MYKFECGGCDRPGKTDRIALAVLTVAHVEVYLTLAAGIALVLAVDDEGDRPAWAFRRRHPHPARPVGTGDHFAPPHHLELGFGCGRRDAEGDAAALAAALERQR